MRQNILHCHFDAAALLWRHRGSVEGAVVVVDNVGHVCSETGSEIASIGDHVVSHFSAPSGKFDV